MTLNEEQDASGPAQDPEAARYRIPVVLSKARGAPTGQIVDIDISEVYAVGSVLSGDLGRVSRQEPVAGL